MPFPVLRFGWQIDADTGATLYAATIAPLDAQALPVALIYPVAQTYTRTERQRFERELRDRRAQSASCAEMLGLLRALSPARFRIVELENNYWTAFNRHLTAKEI